MSGGRDRVGDQGRNTDMDRGRGRGRDGEFEDVGWD